MIRWNTTHWSAVVLALAISMCYEASAIASIQIGPAVSYNESHLTTPLDDSASSGHGAPSSPGTENSPDRAKEPGQLLLRWRASDRSPSPASGSSSSSPSTLGLAGGVLLAAKEFQLPDINDRIERLVSENSILAFTEFISRLIRPPRSC